MGSALVASKQSTPLNMNGVNGINGIHSNGVNGFHHEDEEEPMTNGYCNGMNGHSETNGMNGHSNGFNGHSNGMNGHSNGMHGSCSTINEETEEDSEEEELDSFNALYRIVHEETPPPEMPPVRKKSVVPTERKSSTVMPPSETAKERARKASRDIIRERNDTSGGGKRSLKREHLIIKWILRIIHKDKDGSIDFADWIQDGQVLSNVMTTLCFNSVERDRWSSFGCSPDEQRVKDVRTQILDYGVKEKYLFRLEDVTKKLNTPKVIRCLEEVAKLSAHETHIKYDTLLSNKLYT